MGVTGPGIPIAVFVIANILICFFNENFPGARLLRLPRLLLVSNRSEFVPPNVRPRTYWCWDILDPNHQATSFCVRPVWLLVLRCTYLLYFAATLLVYRFADPGGLGTAGDYFRFLTNLSFILFGLSGLLGVAVSASYILRGPCRLRQPQFLTAPAAQAAHPSSAQAAHPALQNGTANDAGVTGAVLRPPPGGAVRSAANGTGVSANAGATGSTGAGLGSGSGGSGGGPAIAHSSAVHSADVHAGASGQWPMFEYPLLYKLHLLFVETDACMALFITCFFWGLVFPLQKGGVDPSNPMVHGCHNLFIALDLAFSRIPLVSYHYQVVLWYGTAYAIVMWSIAAATGEWVYPMMNWGIAWSLIAYVLLPLLPFIAFLIWYYVIVKPREWLGHRLAKGPRGAFAAPTDGRPVVPQHGADKV